MFQGHPQSLPVAFPFKGINTNSQEDTNYARFIQNIIVGDNKTGSLRYGTSLISKFDFDPNRTFKDIISIMPFLKEDGTSEKLIYVKYLSISYLTSDSIDIIDDPLTAGYSEITIHLDDYEEDQKEYLKKVLFDGVYIFFRQTISDGAEIENLVSTEDTITFMLPFRASFFDNNYTIFIERAAIYRINQNNTYELIQDELDPLVIISYVNFQGKLLIANGVETVKVYDGTNLLPLKSPVAIPNVTPITTNGIILTFSIPAISLAEIQEDVRVNDTITLVSDIENRTVVIAAISFSAPVNNQVVVTLSLIHI